ncbi:hypothetical protein [Haloferula sp. A504]|uniref:hypothetical protein n=1 Tax=Haloferula sp. A504 TaxID=3373601 RepID=UPI0031C7ABD4|nr:hypothetical protein [Verrucomicrobiaceae bacterium E54]
MIHFVGIDFEFRESKSGQVEVVCMVAIDLETDRVYRTWLEGRKPPRPPFPRLRKTILVAHAVAPAEARCWRALGWKQPAAWIDTYAEARIRACGGRPDGGFGLLACCRRHGIEAISSDEKESMRDLVLKGAPYSEKEKAKILDYCETDVRETIALFKRLSGG